MPVMIVSETASREEYEAVAGRLDFAADRPAGLIAHGAGEREAGGVRIVSFWESADDAQAFERDRLFPAFEALGVSADTQQRPELVETFEYVGYSGTTAVT
ncbi:MAG: hypothetical protein QOE98_1469 [Gaiellaceae bacterium]|jgi:heme-degrading monooxygenase HmoA|nr:hypothetical protein [Gaiellaceae bacterium]